jgi:hypothetical protein
MHGRASYVKGNIEQLKETALFLTIIIKFRKETLAKLSKNRGQNIQGLLVHDSALLKH